VVLDQVDAALLDVINSAGGNIGRGATQRLLRPERQDIPPTVAPRLLTSALVLLEDCHSPAMAAYGTVDGALPSMLDLWPTDLEAEPEAL
jgi:hypothetical protein